MNNIPAIENTFGASKQEFNHHPKNDTVISLDELGNPLSYFERALLHKPICKGFFSDIISK